MLPTIPKGDIIVYSAMMLSLLSKWWDQCEYDFHGFMYQINNIDKICKVIECENNKGTKSYHEVPKVIMRYQKSSRGSKYKWKVTDNHIWFGLIFLVITKLCATLEWLDSMSIWFHAILWILEQSKIWVKLASYKSNCEQTWNLK